MAEKRVPLGPAGRWLTQAVRQHRERQGLAYTDLAERLSALGRPLGRRSLHHIERGDRRVDIDDLLALARVLGVPPVLLVFPLGGAVDVEVLPGVVRPTWLALRWLTGEGWFPDPADPADADVMLSQRDDWRGYAESADVLIQHREHDTLLGELRFVRARLPGVSAAVSGAGSDSARRAHKELLEDIQRQAARYERQLVEHRRRMRRAGMIPPPLEPELAHLDDAGGGTGGGTAAA